MWSTAKKWTMAHNMYRCLHDVPFVEWKQGKAQSIYSWVSTNGFTHSSTADGENLYWSYPVGDQWDATSSWWKEYYDCSSMPGCQYGSGATGHFTAMTWYDVKGIGCGTASDGAAGCRYASCSSSDYSCKSSCKTPNMGGCYKERVPKYTRSWSSCKSLVEQCFGLTWWSRRLQQSNGSEADSLMDEMASAVYYYDDEVDTEETFRRLHVHEVASQRTNYLEDYVYCYFEDE